MDWTAATAPSLYDIALLAEETRKALPQPFDYPARSVVIQVEELADQEMLAELEIDDPYELTGLYDGIPLTERSVMDQPEQPDIIWLFRRAILEEWAERGDVTLAELVNNVVIHEFAHHFGWSDKDIARIDQWWE
ncbi:metallopeptidase family protein [Tropicimonas marinistellae]|uniref:metallopeptidase family protein n=1 Tax=Tropicimonas marinistellae TaxID=1739787 RepID=UPI000830E1E7|nr:metallopeptidase family protein [Tropicimonas marinistellae]